MCCYNVEASPLIYYVNQWNDLHILTILDWKGSTNWFNWEFYSHSRQKGPIPVCIWPTFLTSLFLKFSRDGERPNLHKTFISLILTKILYRLCTSIPIKKNRDTPTFTESSILPTFHFYCILRTSFFINS